MATALPNFLDKPTYILVTRLNEGFYFNETKAGATLMNVVGELEGHDDIEAVLMVEDYKIVDVTSEVAWAWYNAHQGQPFFEDIALPDIVQEHCGDNYAQWCSDSRYETATQRSHEHGLGNSVRYL